jgi:hypothetical protein
MSFENQLPTTLKSAANILEFSNAPSSKYSYNSSGYLAKLSRY